MNLHSSSAVSAASNIDEYKPPPTPVCLSYQHKKIRHSARQVRQKDDPDDDDLSEPRNDYNDLDMVKSPAPQSSPEEEERPPREPFQQPPPPPPLPPGLSQ